MNSRHCAWRFPCSNASQRREPHRSAGASMNRVAVIDDFQKVAAGLVDWSILGSDVEIEFFSDHVEGDELVARLQPFDIV